MRVEIEPGWIKLNGFELAWAWQAHPLPWLWYEGDGFQWGHLVVNWSLPWKRSRAVR